MGRSTKKEAELLQRRIWMYRARGMTLVAIGKAIGKKKSTVAYHLNKARKNAYEWYEGVGESEIIGEMLLNFRECRQEAQRNLARCAPGTPMRLSWAQEVRQSLKLESNFLFDLGLLKKAAEKVNIQVTDVRSMSSDEIERQIMRMRKELALTPVQGITMERGGESLDAIDAEHGPVVSPRTHKPRLAAQEHDKEDKPKPKIEEETEGIPDEIPLEEDEYEEYEEFEPFGGSAPTPSIEAGP